MAQVYNGDLTISSQSEIDSFNYSEITGTLTIEETTTGDIINLNGLSILTTIDGGLSITNNTSLSSLNGLDNLTFIGSGPIDALGNGIGLNIVNNNTLSSIASLTNVTSIGSNLTITDNQSLLNLLGLEGITSISGNISISNNTNLNTLNGLNNLTSVNQGSGFFSGYLTVENNSSITTLQGLDNLSFVRGNLRVLNNSSLINLNGLNSLTTTSATSVISIGSNSSLTTLQGIQNLTEIGSISIYNNNSLVSLNGLQGLVNISGSIAILSNSNLSSLDGLNNLAYVGGSLEIGNAEQNGGYPIPGNVSLMSLNALSNLTIIGDKLTITGCDSLISLDGLENIHTIQQDEYWTTETRLQIGSNLTVQQHPTYAYYYNPQLTDYCGIQRLITLGEIAIPTDFIINNNAYNPTLAEIESLNCTLPDPLETVFKWRTATNNGGVSITETINGVTVAFIGDDLSIVDVSGYSPGAYIGGGYDNVIRASVTSSVTFIFSEAVDIVSILTSRSNYPVNHIFTPTGGSNNVVTTTSTAYPSTVNLNWENVTSFTVSTDAASFGFDNLRIINDNSLSVNDYEINNIKLYPNPTTDYIKIQSNFDINSVEVYSLHGQKVLHVEKQKTINISLLPEGIYFLKVKTNKGEITKKVVKR
ncbi:T9SS type A sorting domain-containing protein [Hanstruepera neustonica]|uniref:T9SS type A sorting domain-containing protein n=1 Tax=Hanstruepera neustonica TaxID=1445657 RepID=UPI001A9C9FCC|nr:T9SS type A sorting domain-containing protein [Hanstruepera neustonica]